MIRFFEPQFEQLPPARNDNFLMKEIEAGRWIVLLGAGFELEIVLVGGCSWAFYRFRGELFADRVVGAG